MRAIEEQVAKAIHEAEHGSYNAGIFKHMNEQYRKAARAAIAAMPGWQSIASAPKDGTTWLLIYDSVHRSTVIARYHADASAYEGPYGRFVWEMQEDAGTLAERSVTHWMPLPAPPAIIPQQQNTTQEKT